MGVCMCVYVHVHVHVYVHVYMYVSYAMKNGRVSSTRATCRRVSVKGK